MPTCLQSCWPGNFEEGLVSHWGTHRTSGQLFCGRHVENNGSGGGFRWDVLQSCGHQLRYLTDAYQKWTGESFA